jgi:hypothetical protein
LRKGWRVRSTLMFESFGYDEELYEDYRLGQQQSDLSWLYVPFVGTPRLPNVDVELTVNTPQFKTLSANAFVPFGKDENFDLVTPFHSVIPAHAGIQSCTFPGPRLPHYAFGGGVGRQPLNR